ncbi:ABC transporter permease [Ornithinimicrobium sp. INDO-MA30-4]|uniref:ABC transporter permease n=1 Tax=Ornithinimicrobium sp. INDO-MA30-4 TaxID=2908651 RepID=UPI001F3C0766|nr:ABC transporter permease [Ornithinimicrobium sp. INDO-MA30-4]UJH69820.1 ABC transporter permease [Ornithinimicrobium sp. INDO-MA30-4]
MSAAPATQKIRPWAVVAGREIKVKLTDKNFIMSTVFTLVLIAVIFAVQAFFASQASESKVAVVDDDGAAIVASAQALVETDDADAVLESVSVDSVEAGKAAVTEGDADAVLFKKMACGRWGPTASRGQTSWVRLKRPSNPRCCPPMPRRLARRLTR